MLRLILDYYEKPMACNKYFITDLKNRMMLHGIV